jgi:hypothetical protein
MSKGARCLLIMDIHVNLTEKDILSGFLSEFDKIAAREGKKRSVLIKEIIYKYIESHKEGNYTYPIDKWLNNPKFMAIPSIGEIWMQDSLSKLSDTDLSNLKEILYKRYNEVEANQRSRISIPGLS